MCSQSIGLGWNLIFNHPITSVGQRIFWIWTKLKRPSQAFLHQVRSKCHICGEHSRNDFSNVRSSTCIAKSVEDFNYRSHKTASPNRKHTSVDRLGPYILGVAAGAVHAVAIPTAGGKDAKSGSGCIIGECFGRFWRNRHKCARNLRRFSWVARAIRYAPYKWNRNPSLLGLAAFSCAASEVCAHRARIIPAMPHKSRTTEVY
jgi:hypothetical protein